MNKYIRLFFTLILSLTLICCGGKKTEVDPDNSILDKEALIEEIMAQESSQDLMVALLYEFEESIVDVQRQTARLQNRITEKEAIVEEIMARESSDVLPEVQFYELEEIIKDNQRQIVQLQTRIAEKESILEKIIAHETPQELPITQFYDLEESIEDIQGKIAQLQTQVMEYDENESHEINYTERLKELIDVQTPTHKISLKNGSIIEGTIEKDLMEKIIVKTKVGALTIDKNEIEFIQDHILPVPNIVFIGHGQKQVYDSHYLFTGKVMNQGNRRGDFVRVIYHLWGENTRIISSDSAFVAGTQVMYKSGIVTDTALEPKQSSQFSVKVPIDSEIPISYVTREVHWLIYD